MRLIFLTLFLASTLQLALSILSAPRLTCHTCVNISIPDIRNNNFKQKTRPELFSDPCWFYSGKGPHQQQCQDPHEVCTAAFFYGGTQRIMVRTCLNLTMKKTLNSCGFLIATNHSKSAHNFFRGFFNRTDAIKTRICTCSTDNCNANNSEEKDAKYIDVATNRTLNVQNLIYNKFLEIIRSNKTYEILLTHFAERLPTTTAPTIPPDFGEFGQKDDYESTPVFDNTSNFIPTTEFLPGPLETEGVTEIIDNTNILKSSTVTNHFKSQNDTSPNSTSDDIADNNSTSIIAKLGSFTNPQKIFTLKVIVPVLVFTLILAMLIISLILRHRSRPKNQIKDQLNKYFNKETNEPAGNMDGVLRGYDKTAFEIPIGSFKIDESKMLYNGEYEKACFVRIIRGKNKTKATAKMPKTSSSNNILPAVCIIIHEIKILSFIGSHEHIVYFVGACTEDLKNGRVYVFHEVCSLGPLESFLSYLEIDTRYSFEESVISMDLNKWSKQVAEGMEFVASKQVVHADLCSKNILLDSQKTAKIANFGYAQRVEHRELVKQLRPSNLQWQPPESLTKWKFTEKSDVWAYGVLLWELYTLGDKPYSNLAYPSNFATQVERGYRLERPLYANDEIYKLMLQCWSTEPEQRPEFSEIVKKLTDFGRFNANIARHLEA